MLVLFRLLLDDGAIGLQRKTQAVYQRGNSACECKQVDEVCRVIVRLRKFKKA